MQARNVPVENRNSLVAAVIAGQADGFAERDAGLLLSQGSGRRGGSGFLPPTKGYDDSRIRGHGMRSRLRTALPLESDQQPRRTPPWLRQVKKPFGWVKLVELDSEGEAARLDLKLTG